MSLPSIHVLLANLRKQEVLLNQQLMNCTAPLKYVPFRLPDYPRPPSPHRVMLSIPKKELMAFRASQMLEDDSSSTLPACQNASQDALGSKQGPDMPRVVLMSLEQNSLKSPRKLFLVANNCVKHRQKGRSSCDFSANGKSCEKYALRRGRCSSHGGGIPCSKKGCTKVKQSGGFCYRHGGGKRCRTEGCSTSAAGRIQDGLCQKHAKEVVIQPPIELML